MGAELLTEGAIMSEENCLFCKILNGEIPADIVYESDTAIAFRDINAKAPTHVLVIPRKHISTMNDIEVDDETVIGSLYTAARDPGSRKCRQLAKRHSWAASRISRNPSEAIVADSSAGA
jgi:hypothetical protein